METELTIPLLPCQSITPMLEFYTALGFEVTYQQSKPNNYACVQRGGINLHFFSMRDYEPANSYSSCLLIVPEVDALYRAFNDGLRAHYGKRLVAGIPRITRLSDRVEGGRGFNLIDPGGNWIRISGQNATPEPDAVESTAPDSESTRLSRAFKAADLLTHFKGDYAAAAKMLDAALADSDDASALHRIPAMVLRAELAITMGEPQRAQDLILAIQQISLDDAERTALIDALQTADDLAQMLE